MKTKRRYIVWVYVIAAGWFLAVAHARGDVANYATQVKSQDSQYKTPEDVLDKIPFLGEIPRTFLMGDGYSMKLTVDQMRIDHMGNHSHTKGVNRTCMLGVSYTTPVAFFTTRIDLPIFSSPTLALSDWQTNSLGDYVVYMSRLPVDHATLMLSLTARF
jgi:hypothetical protein